MQQINSAAELQRLQFPHALGVALVPDNETTAKVLAVTDAAFQIVKPKDGLRLSVDKIPHVSAFQNMFRDVEQAISLVKDARADCRLPTEYALQHAPDDMFIWAGDRPFIAHVVDPELALFHDYLLVECIIKGRDTICSAAPADSRPLAGLSAEQDVAYRETGYVFSGAGSEIAKSAGVQWSAFTMPHFTVGVIDWETRPAGMTIAEAQNVVVDSMRTAAEVLELNSVRFNRLAVFRVQPGGVYVPTAENTVAEFAL